MATPPSPTPAPEGARIGAFGRVIGAIVNPAETFADIARRPSWLAPVVLLTLISVVFIVSFTRQVGWKRFINQQIAQNPRAAAQMEQIPAERRDRVLEQQVKVSEYIGYCVGLLAPLVSALVVGAVTMGAANLLGSAGVNYRTALGVTAHAYMPSAISGLLSLLLVYLKDPDTFDLKNPIASNVGAVLGEDAPAWLVSLGQSLDLFSFWTLALLAVGYAAAAPRKLTTGRAFGLMLLPWAIYVLAKVGIAAVFS